MFQFLLFAKLAELKAKQKLETQPTEVGHLPVNQQVDVLRNELDELNFESKEQE